VLTLVFVPTEGQHACGDVACVDLGFVRKAEGEIAL